MPRQHLTANGLIDFTAEEESEADARIAAYEAGADDRAASSNREKRNALLAETDYLALSDQTLTDDMKTYRENLRAIPEQAGFPNSVSWPTKPE